MQPLSVLHVIWSAGMGGIGKVVFHLLQEQINDKELKTGILIAKDKGELLNDFRALPTQVFIAGFNKGIQFNKEIINTCNTAMNQADIIHFHTFNPILAYLAKRHTHKIIYTEHGNFALERATTLGEKILRKLQRHFLNTSAACITYNSHFSRDVSMNKFNIHPNKYKVIYNGVPGNFIETGEEKQQYREPGTFLIAAIGRLVPVKRFDRLIESFKKLSIPDARLIIMGDGPESASLKQLAGELLAEKKIIFTGYGNSRDLLQACDVCVASSRGEAFGLIAIEAYQLGKKVIAFEDGGGLTEIIERLEPESIVKSIEELCGLLKKSYQESGLAAPEINAEKRRNYARNFSIEKMASEFKDLYKSL